MNQTLSLLVPKFVKDLMNRGIHNLQKDQGEVAILFCDICDFDKIIAEEQKNIVNILDKIFRVFDYLCSEYNCQKIETVGKTYMACSGLKGTNTAIDTINGTQFTKQILELSFGMMQKAQKFTWGVKGNPIILKIGIHYGPVIAGVIGHHKPQFSLIGDTVNTTSRVCSTGANNNIIISESAYQKIKYLDYDFSKQVVIKPKGKEEMLTYYPNKNKKINNSNRKIKNFKKIQNSQKLQNANPANIIKENHNKNDQFGIQNQSQGLQILSNIIKSQKLKLQEKRFSKKFRTIISNGSRKQSLINKLLEIENEWIFQKEHNQTFEAKTKKKPNLSLSEKFQEITRSDLLSKKASNINDKENLTNKQFQIQKGNQNNTSYFNLSQRFSYSISSKSINPQNIKRSARKLKSSLFDMKYKHSSNNMLKSTAQNKTLQKFKEIQIRDSDQKAKQQLSTNQSKQKIIHNMDEVFDNIENIDIDTVNEIQLPKGTIITENSEILSIDQEDQKEIDIQTNLELFHNKNSNCLLFNKYFLYIQSSENANSINYQEIIQEYELEQCILGKNSNLFILICFIIFITTQNILSLFIRSQIQYFVILFIIRVLISFGYLISIVFYQKLLQNSYLKIFTITSVLFLLNVIYFPDYETQSQYYNFNTIIYEKIIIFLFLTCLNYIQFHESLTIGLFSLIQFIVRTQIIQKIQIENFDILFICFFFSLIQAWMFQKFQIQRFNNLQQSLAKKQQLNNIVENLLPIHVYEKFVLNPTDKLDLIDTLDDVTLLFADIANFTEFCAQTTPNQVVTMLKELFTEFDKQCLIFDVYKLYTIGDCYVVMGIIDKNERNPEKEALNVINFAFSMIEIIQRVRKHEKVNFKKLDMRIGIHTGNIIGGILGTELVRYDIYGTNVLIANKIESNGKEGRVVISESTKSLVESGYRNQYFFEFFKEIEFKNIEKTIKTYLVQDCKLQSDILQGEQ